ncbi:Ig-like domain-containing protein [Flavobacteriaceae bacterium]|nr:Ig-like domain-containing protein [Flavobacteriaceae bacterium]
MKNFLSLFFLTFSFLTYSQNVAPTVADATATITEGATGQSISVTVSDGDSGDTWTLSVVSAPSVGTVNVNGDSGFYYDHDGSEGNEVTFTYRATDDKNNESSIATVTITVTGVNDMPTVEEITKTVDENSTTEIILSGNDAEGSALVYSLVNQPNDGTFTFDTATGVGSYVHNGNENASDTFSYKVCEDGTTNCSSSQNIVITITNVNDSPIVADAVNTLLEGGSVQTTLSISDPEGSALTLSVSSDGANGTSTVSGSEITYTHDGSETTSDSVTFSVSDGTLSTTGTITFTINAVNDAPTGVADTYYISLTDTLKISSKVGVLRNDTDSDSKFETISSSLGSTSPASGNLEYNSDGSFSYIATSTTGFNSDTFSYIPSDGSSFGSEVTVTLEVVDITVDPNAYDNVEASTLDITAANGLLSNDKDVNNLDLTAAIATSPLYGTLTLAADGSFSYVHDGSENLRDVFTYNVTNANGDISKTSFAVITHTNVNDSPTSAGTALTINEGASSTFTPTYTDTDTDLSSIVFTITGDVSNGSLVNNGDGTFSYSHAGTETSSDSFVYSVSDGEFTVSDIAGTISVTAVNDVPVVSALEYTLDEAGSQVLAFASTDAESDSVTYSVSTNPTNGTVVSSDGVFTYTHNGSESSSDTFQYVANDGTGNSQPVSVTITVTPVNDAPIVTAGTISLNEGSNSSITLSASDAEGDAMTYAIATAPTNGTVTLDTATGALTYTHSGGENTSDTFTFTSSDSALTSSAGTVTVTVTAVNDAPVISADTFAVDQFDEVTFNIPATDAEGNSLTYTVETDPTKGTLLDNGGGSFTYFNNTPTSDYTDAADAAEVTTDTFVVKANDGSLDSADTTLTFNVTEIDTTIPQVLLTSSASSITETSAGNASLTVNAVLISNDFYSVRRDMNAIPVSAGAENSLGLIYLGESNGKKYYVSRNDGSDSNVTGSETYSTASTAAKNFGGYLAVFETETEQTNVNNLIKAQSGLAGNQFWIGYQYNYESPVGFIWANGWTGGGDTLYTDSSNFDVSDSPVSRRYVYFQSSGSDNGYWDNTASGNYRYLLEFDNNVSAASGKAVDLVITTNSADSNGIALIGTDYSLSATTLTIPAGSSSASITINEGAANTTDEPTELIALTAALAGSEADARIKSSQKTLSINLIDDDDTAVTWSTGGTVTEGTDSSVALTATLNNVKPFDTAITLNISGTATVEDDYASDDDGYLTTVKQINEAYGLVQDSSGNIYVASSNSRQIFKIDTSGNQTTYAGTGGWENGVPPSTGTPASLAIFREIKSMAIDTSGTDDILYLVDQRLIKKINLTTNLVYYITGTNQTWQNSFTNGEFDEAYFGNIEDITVSNDGASLYVLDQNAIRKITDLAGDGSVTTISGQWDWDYRDGTLSQARFEGPQGIDMDTNGNLWVRQYGKLRKVDLSADSVTTVLSNMPWGSGDLTIDSSNTIYFADRNEARLYEYSITNGDLYTLIDSSNDRGTVDGITKDAKIERPTQLLATASALYFTQRLNGSNGGLRKIDFINKLRIPAGQSSGTFTLSIIDDGVYETAETINVKVTAAENIQFDSSNVVEYSLADNDTAPKVSLVSSSDIIAEEGGKAILTFQLGDASESGGKLDMSPGLKSSYIYLGEKDNHKYYLSDNHQSYTNAKQIATDAGGYLTAIDSAVENSFIRDQMQSAGYNWESVWIGFNDEETEGNFKWVNGSKSTYVNWQNGEPNNSGGREDYTELMNNGYWNDLPNDHNRRYVVEFSGSISSVDTVIEYAVTGSDGYETEFDNIVGTGSVTISAGQSVKTVEIAASSDTTNDPIDSITYTITGVTGDSADAQLGTDLSKTVQINDNDAPVLSWAASAATLEEDSGTVSVTATIEGSITKLSSSTLNVNVNPSSDDTAVYGLDYEIVELNQVSTFAGSGQTGSNDGIGTDAKFRYPMGSVLDASGNLYVADNDNNLIRKIDISGNVTTWAGNGDWAHDRNEGSKLDVGFARPAILVFDASGNMYVAENGRQRISKIDTSGNVTHVSGNGDWGDASGDKNSTQFRNIAGMAFDSSGNLFVSERDNHKVKRITFDPSSGAATSEDWVGSGSYDYANGNGTDASFRHPWGIAIDSSDNLYVSDHNSHRIRKVTPSKDVTDYAGNGNWGQKDGSLATARFRHPGPLTFDSNGDLWVADQGANTIIKIDVSEGYVSRFAGKVIDNNSHSDGTLDEAKFSRPSSISLNSTSIFVVDNESHRVRKIDLLPSITIPATQTSASITLRGIDDYNFENAESITLGAGSTTNIDASSSFANLSITLNSGDPLPVVRLSSQEDVLDETGTVELKVSLSDSYSSSKLDMSQGSKSDFYYLGEYKGSKYYSAKNDHLQFDDANSRAAELGGQLAVITSSGEQDFVVNGIYNNDPNFSVDNNRWLNHWIGLEYDKDDASPVWEWTNGIVSNYSGWVDDWQENYNERREAAYLHTDGTWHSTNKNDHRRFVIEFSSAISDANTTIGLNFDGSTATADTDFTSDLASGNVVIAAGSANATVTLTGVSGDGDESIETVTVNLASAEGGTLSDTDNSTSFNINDSDLPVVTLSIENDVTEISENGGTVNILASLSNEKLNSVSIPFAFASSGEKIAIFDKDYESTDINKVSEFFGDGNTGFVDGDDLKSSRFSGHVGNLSKDSAGNIYFADTDNRVIRKIDASGNLTTWAGNGNCCDDQSDRFRTDTDLRRPRSIAFDSSGNAYITESGANRIAKIDTSGNLTRWSGDFNYGRNNGEVSQATYQDPMDLLFDSQGNLFVLEQHSIRKIEFSGDQASISDFVGNGNWGDNDGTGADAQFGDVQSFTIDSNDNIYFADRAHQRIKKVTPEGVVTTIAGNGNWDFADGYGNGARFRQPSGISIDSDDNLYVADQENNRIRKIELTNDGRYKVSTLAGDGEYGSVNGVGSQAQFKRPELTLANNGVLYVYVRDESKIKKIDLNPQIIIPAGQKTASFNISGIDDISYESTETISITPSVIGGTLKSADPFSLNLTSDDAIPSIKLSADNLILDENGGSLQVNVVLTDASGATGFWVNSDLPQNAQGDYDFVGEYKGNKYYFSKFSTSWTVANQNALDLGGQMLVIDDMEEQEFIQSIMIHNGTWVGTKAENGPWTNNYGDSTFTNFGSAPGNNETGYVRTYGNQWYSHQNSDNTHYIVEFGPVKTSELPSTVNLVFAGDATIDTDYSSNQTAITVPAGSQSVSFTLTGLNDESDEPVEKITVTMADPNNVELSSENSLEFKISDDEKPAVTFTISETEIAENGGSTTVTAEISNPKISPVLVNFDLQGTSLIGEDYNSTSINRFSRLAGSVNNQGVADGKGEQARFVSPSSLVPYGTSVLVADYSVDVIKEIKEDGTVSTFLGKAYQRGNFDGTVSREETRLDQAEGMAVTPGGIVYLANFGGNSILKFDPNTNETSVVVKSNGWGDNDGGPGQAQFRGPVGLELTSNGDLFVSEFYGHRIRLITFDSEGNASYVQTIAGGRGGEQSGDQDGSFQNSTFRYPNSMLLDESKNVMYVTGNDTPGIRVLDFNNSTVSTIYLDNIYNTRGFFGITSDSSGNLYTAVGQRNSIAKVSFNDEGQPYYAGNISPLDNDGNDLLNYPLEVSTINGVMYVSNYNSKTVDKIALGAGIEIPSEIKTQSATFTAFKDISFEEDETIDVKISSIINGDSSTNDVGVVTILESTRLTKVEAPFEGVENGKVSWGDYDRDGDMDLLLMGQGSDGTITNVYRNDGNDESGNPKFVNTSQNFTKFIGGDIEFVDVDQDGWLDVAVTGVSPQGRKSELYMNRNGEFFELNTDYVVEGLSQSDMEWADLDDDSDQDLIITGIDSNNQTRTYYYTNLGNFNFFKEELFERQSEGVQRGEIDIVDRDKDGDNDLFISGVNNNENIRRMEFNNTYYYYNPQNNVSTGLADGNTEYLDIDGDGELDYLTIGRRDDNSEEVFVESNLFDLNLPNLKNVDFDFSDYNNDGMSDLIITGEDQNSGVAVSKLYLTFKELYGSDYKLLESDLPIDGLRESSANWIDYDKDGDLDLFLTGLDVDGKPKSILYKAENRFNTNQAPTAPKNVQAFPYGGNGNMYIQWESPDDDNSSSFRYAVRIGTEPGASDILYANSITDTESANFGSTLIDIPGLLTRNNINVQVLPGTYYISVQAIDGGNIGGPFSEEISVEADYAWNLQRLGGIIDRRLDTDESSQIKFMDMDKDGDMDLIGSNVGTRYSGRQAINILAFQNDIFQPKKGFSGGDSTFEIADFNNDGNEDIIMSVDEGTGSRIWVLLNTYDQDEERVAQGGEREYFTERNFFEGDNFFPSLFNVKFAIKDLNNDGLLEIIAAGESSKISSEATAKIGIVSINPFNEDNSIGFDNFTFSEVTDLGGEELTSLSFSSYDFGDIDNDGDYDFLISGYSFDGYKTYLYENKRKLDDNGAVVQPVEVNYELTNNNFVSVKDGTTQFVDIDQDGKLDIIFSGQSSEGDVFRAYKNTGNIDNFASIDIGLPAVRNGNFIFGDIFGEGRNDVIFSGTVTGQGTFSRLAFLPPGETKYVESNYDLFVDNGKIGLADFDGDLDTDLVLTGKWRNDLSNNDYRGFVYINVRGYSQDTGIANNNGDIKTSGANGVKQQSNDGASSSGSSLNTRPEPPTSISYQRQRIGDKTYEVVINWNSGTDKETPDEGLTYSLMIGTSEGAQDILASGANSDGVRATGTRGNAENNKSWKVVLKEGQYHVAVQAVDASFIGSKFSESFEFTVANSTKLGDSNGDDSVNILDLTSNVDYILGNTPAVFVNEVADVNGDGKIDVADISGIVNIIMNGTTGAAQGSTYDPYVWEYFSNKPVGDATLVRRDGRIFLENDKPVTSLQFSIDSTVEYELSEELDNLTVVNFVEDNKRTFLIYSFNNQPVDELTDVIFDYLDLNDGDDFEINDMTAGTKDGLLLNLKYSDESFFDDSENVIQIYPNPAISNVNLLTDITMKVETIEVDVYNVLGVSVYKTSIESMGRLNDLDVSMLSSGVYTVRVRMVTDKNEEIINVHKLIKK